MVFDLAYSEWLIVSSLVYLGLVGKQKFQRKKRKLRIIMKSI